eukprot:UN34866
MTGERFVLQHDEDDTLYGHIRGRKEFCEFEKQGLVDNRVVEFILKFKQEDRDVFLCMARETRLCRGEVSLDSESIEVHYYSNLSGKKLYYHLEKQKSDIPHEEREKFHHTVKRSSFLELTIRLSQILNPEMAPFEALNELLTTKLISYAMDVVELDMRQPDVVRLQEERKNKIK